MPVDLVGPVLSGLFQVVFDRIFSRPVYDFYFRSGLAIKDLEDLQMQLLSVSPLINDAEEKQFIEPFVRKWIHELREVLYRADDVFEEIATDAWDQVRGHSSSLDPENVNTDVQNIIRTLKSLINHKDHLGLKENSIRKLQLSWPTTSLVAEREVYGRASDMDIIKSNFVLSENANREGVPVIAIIGMAGIGKTTLAQLLYNDARVAQKFPDFRFWVYVSGGSNVYETTKSIFESVTLSHPSSNITDLNALQLELKNRLSEEKFLLVLDDFWNENFLDWDVLKRPFQAGDSSSRIIVTTRSHSVALAIRADQTHSLARLEEDDSWKLFSSHAFKSSNPDRDYPVLTKIGKKIVKRCAGLPLAAKTLGSLLRSKEDVEEWDGILRSKIWELPNDKSNIHPTLMLSYGHLPLHLKRCFTFCSIIPKGCMIEKQKLIYLWMAENILPQPRRGKTLQDVGEECLQELLAKSFFQQTGTSKLYINMHDVVNELAESVAGEFFYKIEDSNPSKTIEKARHLSYAQDRYDPSSDLNYYNLKKLRTFLPLSSIACHSSSIPDNSIPLARMKNLRALSLSGYLISTVPSHSILGLKHLRYLDLSFNSALKELPHTICSLYWLETLILTGCHGLTMLPDQMFQLINLRHLDISGCGLQKMPAQLHRLENLRVLTTFVVSKDVGANINVLGKLSQLSGSLEVLKLENVVNENYASNAGLKSKNCLQMLQLKWTITQAARSVLDTHVLDRLEPNENLKRLEILNFGGNRLPDWLGNSVLSRLVSLRLSDCGNCMSLPSLGQLSSLRELYIQKMRRLQKLGGPEFYGNGPAPFRSLKTLKFEELDDWDDWSPRDINEPGEEFSCLQVLEIRKCGKLRKNLLNPFSSLNKLVISECASFSFQNAWGLEKMTSLTCLRILEFPNVTSLEHIGIHHLTSLKKLEIERCAILQHLPLQALANSLSELNITDCPGLATLCEEIPNSNFRVNFNLNI